MAKKKSGATSGDVSGCLALRDMLGEAKCGIAVAEFSMGPDDSTAPASVKLAAAGASTAVSVLERFIMGRVGDEAGALAKKVKAPITKARNILREAQKGVPTKELIDKAKAATDKAAKALDKLKAYSDDVCSRGRR